MSNHRKTRIPILPSACLILATITLAISCSKTDSRGVSPQASTSSSAQPAPSLAHMPPAKTTGRTTSGDIAMGNLDGEIQGLERLLATRPSDLGLQRSYVEALKLRGDMVGRFADIEKAAEKAETFPQAFPDKPAAYLTRASLRAALHRFDDAWADLDEAERHGASAAQTRFKRATIQFARGRITEALTLAQQVRHENPTIDTIGFVAVLLGELGRQSEAIAAFQEAFTSFKDTSPFPVAWLFFAEGQFWEREGNLELAKAYHRACLERLPVHAHAAAHLARLSPPDQAENILQLGLATSDDPELESVLSAKLDARGDTAGAKEHREKAAARYDALVAKHPEAFADHAAQFWLDVGGDPKKSLELAKRNLLVRKTPQAYELAVVAALAAREQDEACTIGTEGLGQTRVTSMFRDIVKGACGTR